MNNTISFNNAYKTGLLSLALFLMTGAGASAQVINRPGSEARLPSLVSATGLIQIPSAYLQRDLEVTVFGSDSRTVAGGALVSIANRLELGLAAGDPESGSKRRQGTAKLNLLADSLVTPAISVGLLDGFDSAHGYVVVSKQLIPSFLESLVGLHGVALNVHAGYGNGIYRNKPFVGAEVWGKGALGALGEISDGKMNLGLRYFHQGIGGTFGWLDKSRLAGNVSYTIGLK